LEVIRLLVMTVFFCVTLHIADISILAQFVRFLQEVNEDVFFLRKYFHQN